MTVATAEPTAEPTAAPVAFLDGVRFGLAPRLSGELASYFSSKCGQIDAGSADVHDGLEFLASRGLVGGVDLPTQATVIREVSTNCMSSAFSLWAQVMVANYLQRAESPLLRHQAELVMTAQVAGSTAMAGAFQDADGFRELETTFRFEDDDVILDGAIRWASNLRAEGFVMVLGARNAEGDRIIVAVPSDVDGLSVREHLDLLALGGTASSSVNLDGVRVSREWILTENFAEFVAGIRPTFLLLQTAFCLGLIDASLSASAARLESAFEGHRDEYVQLSGQRDDLDGRFSQLLTTPAPRPRDLVEIRLDSAALAQAVVSIETRIVGGAGYVASSPTARRLREAAFLPIQSPTEGHLRWLLATSVS